MKKTLLLLLSILLGFSLTACDNKEKTQEVIEPEIEEEAKRTSIYKVLKNDKYAEVNLVNPVFKASYGYTNNDTQGYNYFNYKGTTDKSNYIDMSFDSGWNLNDATIKNGVLKSGQTLAAYEFVSPVAGNAKITGNVKMATQQENKAYVTIFVNNEQVYPASNSLIIEGTDTVGYYHEFEINLQIGDKVYFVVDGQGKEVSVSWNPKIDFTNSEEKEIHIGLDTPIGDVHPYYYNNQMYFFYLDTDGNFTSRLELSQDLINYTKQEMTINRLNPPGAVYHALGIIKEGNYFRSFFGLGKNVGSSRSTDLINWESGIIMDEYTYETQYSPTSNYPAGTRDPYAFYDPDTNKYHIIATGYRANQNYEWSNTTGYNAHLVLYTSTGPSLAEWEINPVTGNAGYHKKLIEFGDWVHDDAGDPECPQMAKIGDRWYIFASMAMRKNSDHHVGRLSYWIGDSNTQILDVEWQSKKENYLTSEDLCAAQFVQIGEKFYMMGWITQKSTSGGWGGAVNVICEIYQNEDGTLGTRYDEELTQMLNAGKLYSYTKDELPNTNKQNVHGYTDYQEYYVSGNYGRTIINLDAILKSGTNNYGILVKNGSKVVEIGLRKKQGNTYEIYLKDQGANGNESAVLDVKIEDLSKTNNLCIILERNTAEVSVNNKIIFHARASVSLVDGVSLGLFSVGQTPDTTKFDICKLISADDFGD